MSEKRTIEGIVSHFAHTAKGQTNQIVVRVSPALYFNFHTNEESLAAIDPNLKSGYVVKVEFTDLDPKSWKIVQITAPAAPAPPEPKEEPVPPAEEPPAEEPPAEEPEEEVEEEEQEYTKTDLKSMKKDELIALCEYYELDTDGIKTDLVDRLCEHLEIE
jgi:hypothetical protein